MSSDSVDDSVTAVEGKNESRSNLCSSGLDVSRVEDGEKVGCCGCFGRKKALDEVDKSVLSNQPDCSPSKDANTTATSRSPEAVQIGSKINYKLMSRYLKTRSHLEIIDYIRNVHLGNNFYKGGLLKKTCL